MYNIVLYIYKDGWVNALYKPYYSFDLQKEVRKKFINPVSFLQLNTA